MAEAFDVRELLATLDSAPLPVDDRPKTINDLPKELLVSVFEAVNNLLWVRCTVPMVCKAWNELYRSQDASPLHETLELDFGTEKEAAIEWRRHAPRPLAESAAQERPLRRPVVHASRVISWAERRAGWVRRLRLGEQYPGAFEDFSPEDLGRLVAVVGSSLTEIFGGLYDLPAEPFWESVRDSVVPRGRLRSLFLAGALANVSESGVEPLGKLAGSLEELALSALYCDDHGSLRRGVRLLRFPESFCALTELRRLSLTGHEQITAIPAQISSLRKLKELNLFCCSLCSLPKELSELSGLTKLDLQGNKSLGNAPQDEAFPAELGMMKSLRFLNLRGCDFRAVPACVGELESLTKFDLGGSDLGNTPEDEAFPADLKKLKSLRDLGLSCCFLRTVPAFVGELKSLEFLDLSLNSNEQIYATLDILIRRCPRLREVRLSRPITAGSRARLGGFMRKLFAENPNAKVTFD